jgi:hypothetical protein
MRGLGFAGASTEERPHHVADLLRDQIRRDADHAGRPDRQRGKRHGIVSAQNRNIIRKRLAQLAEALNGPARFLDRDDVWVLEGE